MIFFAGLKDAAADCETLLVHLGTAQARTARKNVPLEDIRAR